MLFKNFIYIVSIAAVAYGATVADVLADLAAVKSRATALDSSIAAFPLTGGNLFQALDIATKSGNTQTAIDKANADALTISGTFSDADGTSILNSVVGIQPIINSALTTIVAKKSAVAALPLSGAIGLVRQELVDLQTSTNTLEVTLVSRTPASSLAQAQAVQSQISAAFATAVTAYSS